MVEAGLLELIDKVRDVDCRSGSDANYIAIDHHHDLSANIVLLIRIIRG